jgi:GNAT superfamily N-acetyltransferase
VIGKGAHAIGEPSLRGCAFRFFKACEMVNPGAVESNFQYVSMWKVLSGDRPGVDLVDRPGMSVCWADSAFPFWNALFLTDRIGHADDLSARLREGAGYMRAKRQAGLVYVCEDFLNPGLRGRIDDLAREAGLEYAIDVFGMAGDVPRSRQMSDTPLEFRRVTDEAALKAYGEINAQGYGFPLEAGQEALRGSEFWKSTAYAFIGYEAGRAVSTAAAIVNEGQLYLALVATLPDAQRKGYGYATVCHALQAAHDATGLTRTTLHATQAGFPVYQRAGYRRTTLFLTYKLA